MSNGTFRPVIKENKVLAGGITIATVDDEGRIIFEDRYRRRCEARGTSDVPVSLTELMEEILLHYAAKA